MMHTQTLAPAFALVLTTATLAHAAPSPSVQVETAPLRHEELASTVEGYGTVAPGEDALVDVNFLHAGQISRLLVRQGEMVTAGEPLLVIATDPSSALSFTQAVTQLAFARRQLALTQRQVDQHLATNAQLATARKTVEDAAATVATERRLGNDRGTETATAPSDGYVASLSVAPGDRVQANATVLKLARSDGLRVSVGLQPEAAARVAAGMTAEIAPIFAPARRIGGAVASVSGTINPASRLIDVWIDAPAARTLVAGTPVSARIVLERHPGWVVPRQAVLRDQHGDYVFQLSGTRAHRVAVTTGVETSTSTEIVGADPALKVVTLGNYELQDGMTVRETVTQ